MPKQNRPRGRPKKNWMEGIRKAINERNLNEGQWENRKQWSLGVGQRRRYIYIYAHKRFRHKTTVSPLVHPFYTPTAYLFEVLFSAMFTPMYGFTR